MKNMQLSAATEQSFLEQRQKAARSPSTAALSKPAAKEGSTIVTLTAEYVATLAVGEHTIGIVSDSGTAETTFAVNPRLPQTGDNSRLTLWMALLLVSGGLLTAVCIRKRSAR